MFNKTNIDKDTILRGLRFAVIISLVISSLIILFTIDEDTLQRLLTKISARYVFYLLIIMILNWIFAGLKIKVLVHTIGDTISLLDGIIVYLGGTFVSFVTPFASGGGPYQVYFLHKKGVNIGKSSTVVVAQFILRLFFFGTLTPIFMIFFNDLISPGAIPGYIFYVTFGIAVIFSVGIIALTLIPDIMDQILNLIFKIKRLKNFFKNSYRAKRILVKARRELQEFRESLQLLIKNKWRLLLATFYTIIYWSLIFMIMPVVLKGLGVEPNFLRAYVMQTIIYLIIPFMPTPGASGIAEVGFASLLVAFIPRNLIGLVTFGWRLYTFYLVLLVGGTIALKEINRVGSIENE